ncbi:dimethyladenosine transferase 2, mitochondrial [Chelonus insularis]|uniref:dimethyladenosine transferase 2, mitochondrial n=1 Tax=Chelonus insularis TaxID=460826 RepID=UPI00158CA5F5|nr:dimethyladenosine transferase 2, mitochondrial [Chelonus insularis]XP_034940014.1 dimethyladenosine transferase 2, mitochondrial [Chelonus insularis]XP_034940016.1 dimethyladenosine transferase 2, mitochondrial [Chelonus insularis]
MILKRLIIHLKYLPKKNVRFFKMCSSQTEKSSNGKINLQSTEKNSNDFNKQDAPSECLEKKKTPKMMYLLNKKGAEQFASIIVKELLKNNVPVLEMQPGFGFLTQLLLDAGVPEIYLYEQKEKFIETLEAMSKKYSQRIHIRKYNLLQLHKIGFLDFIKDEDTLGKVFSGIELANDFNKPSFQIVGPMPNIQLPIFLTSLDPKISFKYEHVVLYVAILPSVSKVFDDIPGSNFHKPRNIYLRVRFKYKILDAMSRKYFYPQPNCSSKKKKNKASYCRDDADKVYVVKLESNHDEVNQKFTKADWYHFVHFLRMGMKNRRSRIIPTLEKWIPGCGPNLIHHNFNIYSTFSELTSPELLNLFNIFRALPGYESSSFMSILQSGMPNYSEIYTMN